jgi:nucleotidyltransferase substrate binding protein (TIGR01987 family)
LGEGIKPYCGGIDWANPVNIPKVKRMSADVRWKQRFQNFDRAYRLLADALKSGPEALSLLEKGGVVQRFEFTFELAWKTLKDYMEENGLKLPLTLPRTVLKEAFTAGLLKDGQVWIDMLVHRNKLSHAYDEATFEEAVNAIATQYLPAIETLHRELENKYKS